MLLDWIKTLPLYPLPHHLVSRVVLWLTRRDSKLTEPAIRRFAKMFNVEMKGRSASVFRSLQDV